MNTHRGAPLHSGVHRPMVMYLHTKILLFQTYQEILYEILKKMY